MGVSINEELQNRPKHTMIRTIGTTQKGTPIFGNPQLGRTIPKCLAPNLKQRDAPYQPNERRQHKNWTCSCIRRSRAQHLTAPATPVHQRSRLRSLGSKAYLKEQMNYTIWAICHILVYSPKGVWTRDTSQGHLVQNILGLEGTTLGRPKVLPGFQACRQRGWGPSMFRCLLCC